MLTFETTKNIKLDVHVTWWSSQCTIVVPPIWMARPLPMSELTYWKHTSGIPQAWSIWSRARSAPTNRIRIHFRAASLAMTTPRAALFLALMAACTFSANAIRCFGKCKRSFRGRLARSTPGDSGLLPYGCTDPVSWHLRRRCSCWQNTPLHKVWMLLASFVQYTRTRTACACACVCCLQCFVFRLHGRIRNSPPFHGEVHPTTSYELVPYWQLSQRLLSSSECSL